MNRVTFWLDFISPFAWLAFERLPQVLEGCSYTVEYRPVLFAGMLQHHATKGPAEVEPKRAWTFRHVHWLAQQHGIALDTPAQHPFNPLALLRLARGRLGAGLTGFEIMGRFALDLVARHFPALPAPLPQPPREAAITGPGVLLAAEDVHNEVVAVADKGSLRCTGTAVARDIILTARHCLPATAVRVGARFAEPRQRSAGAGPKASAGSPAASPCGRSNRSMRSVATSSQPMSRPGPAAARPPARSGSTRARGQRKVDAA